MKHGKSLTDAWKIAVVDCLVLKQSEEIRLENFTWKDIISHLQNCLPQICHAFNMCRDKDGPEIEGKEIDYWSYLRFILWERANP